MAKLEFEFRVYRIREDTDKRDCIAIRNVPHALEVWDDHVDAFQRRLELLISGGWLMQLLEYNESCAEVEEEDLDKNERTQIMEWCLKALTSDDESYRQQCLEQILLALGCSPVGDGTPSEG